MAALAVHPIAALFPMMTKEELEELADDIKKNGLQEAIKLSHDGKMLIDGRNRLAACKIAKVEPRFENLNGVDAEAYVISINLARRHMTPAQRAMVAALVLEKRPPEDKRGGAPTRGKQKGDAAILFPMVPQRSLTYARMVLREAPDLAESVLDTSLTMEKAVAQAKERREDKSSRESKLALLQKGARDLADRVADGMDVDEALAAMRERERKDREIIEQGKQAAEAGLSRFLADVASIAEAMKLDDEILDKKKVTAVVKAANQLQSLIK